ncbi:MAG: sigma-70 family RNA polymerase sigma factor [Myxococcota bacterium]|nr:sigma-70 family RNA polymerase sigma factor [Myxococcota bacterium]
MAGKPKCTKTLVHDALSRERKGFYQFVRARVPPEEVDDIVQQAAMRAIEHASSLKDPQRVIPWLYKIHRNVLVDVVRKKRSEVRLIDDSQNIPEKVQSDFEEWCACSTTQITAINSRYGTILKLVDMKGFSLNEVSRMLGISVNNATVRLHRARIALRKQMLEHCGVSSIRECLDCRCIEDGCCAV